MAQLQPADDNRGTWAGDLSLTAPQSLSLAAALDTAEARRWLRLTLLFTLFCSAALLWWAFRAPYVVQDDGRQHLFWMQRFQDPSLFPGDLTVAYFQSVATPGYSAFYWLLAQVGLPPLLVSKLLPPLFLLAAAVFCFRAAMVLWRDPTAAGIASMLYIQVLATNDDLASGTPRAFIAPLLTGFLYFLVTRAAGGTLLCVALLGLFYPQMAVLALAALVLHTLDRGAAEGAETPFPVWMAVAGIVATLAVVLPYQLHRNPFGPLVTASEARALPEFGPGARSEFFTDNPLYFWLIGSRSGFLPLLYHSPLIWAGFALPSLIRRGTVDPRYAAGARLLAQWAAASIALYLAAHLLLFKLHLPSRYIRHTLPLILALGSGPVLAATWRWLRELPHLDRRRLALTGAAAALFVVPSVLVPLWNPGMVVGHDPALYRFIAAAPKDVVVASLSEDAENLPSFSQRSTLFSSQCALAYHRGYYQKMQERAIDLLRAQYTPDPAVLGEVLQKYRADYFVLDRDAYSESYLKERPWLRPFLREAGVTPGPSGANSALFQASRRATALDTGQHRVLDARRLQQELARLH